MALELKAKKTFTFVGTTSPETITLTSGWTLGSGGANYTPVENDVVIVNYVTGSDADRAIGVDTAGYTEEAELYSNGTVTDTNMSVSVKRMGATPDTSVDVSGTGAVADAGAVGVQVWSGVDITTMLDVASTTATGTGAAQPNPPSITPTTAGTTIIVCGGAGNGTGAVFTQSGSELSNFHSATRADGFDGTVGSGDFAWTSGAFDPVAWLGGGTGTGGSWGAVCLALRPAAGGTAAGRADEVDTALALGSERPVGLATETDTALVPGSGLPVGLATEADTAFALGAARPAGLAVETDTALSLQNVPDVVYTMDEGTAKQTWRGPMIEGQVAQFGPGNQMYAEPGGYQHDLTAPELTRLHTMLAALPGRPRYFRYAAGNFPQRGVTGDGKQLVEHYTTAGLAVAGATQVITTVSQNAQIAAHLAAAGFEGIYFQYWSPGHFWTDASAMGPGDTNAPTKTSDVPATDPTYWNWINDFTNAIVVDVQYAATKLGKPVPMIGLQNEPENGGVTVYSHCNYNGREQVYVDALRVLIPKIRAATIAHTNSAGVKFTCDSWDGRSGGIGTLVRTGTADCITLDMTPGSETKTAAGYNIIDQLYGWAPHNIGRYGTNADLMLAGEINVADPFQHAFTDEMEHFDGERDLHLIAPIDMVATAGQTVFNPAGVVEWAPVGYELVKKNGAPLTLTTDYTIQASGSGSVVPQITLTVGAAVDDVIRLSNTYYPDGEKFMFINLALVMINSMERWNAESGCIPIHLFKYIFDGVGNLGFCLLEYRALVTALMPDNSNATGDPAFDGLAAGEWDYNKRNWNVLRGFYQHLPWDSVRYTGTIASGAITGNQNTASFKNGAQWIHAYVNRSASAFTFKKSLAADRDFRVTTYNIDTATASDPAPSLTLATAADGLVVDVPAWSIVFAVQNSVVSPAVETDTALALSPGGPVGLAAENDNALALGAARPPGLAVTTETALSPSAQGGAPGLATENDNALALGAARPAGMATEAETAFALAAGSPAGLAAEIETAFSLGSARPAGVANSTEQALALVSGQSGVAGLAAENDNALALGSARPPGLANETDEAVGTLHILAPPRRTFTARALRAFIGRRTG